MRRSGRLCNTVGWMIQTNNHQIIKLLEIQKSDLTDEIMMAMLAGQLWGVMWVIELDEADTFKK